MQLDLSVLICTHNPRRDYLERVLSGLKSQSLSVERWELLLIDNASDSLVSSEIDLSWHPQARHIREEQLGKIYALLRGIQEAGAELLVIVDDDNVLDGDYLEVALRISKDWSMLGVWGGQIKPEFEEEPPEWTKPYWGFLAIREFDSDVWSNFSYHNPATPAGAGMCLRKIVAQKYADLVRNDPKHLSLGQKGKRLTRCEDSDMVFTACDIGLGAGQFVSLKLTHLIPTYRLEEEYLANLIEGMYYSGTLLEYFRGAKFNPSEQSWYKKILNYFRLWRMNPRQRRIHLAQKRGEAMALKEILTQA